MLVGLLIVGVLVWSLLAIALALLQLWKAWAIATLGYAIAAALVLVILLRFVFGNEAGDEGAVIGLGMTAIALAGAGLIGAAASGVMGLTAMLIRSRDDFEGNL